MKFNVRPDYVATIGSDVASSQSIVRVFYN